MFLRHPLFPVLAIIAACAFVWFLQTAEQVMAPLLLALTLGVVMAPVTDRIEAIGVKRAISAFLALLLTLGFIGGLILLLGPLVAKAINMAPRIGTELRDIIVTIQPALDSVSDMQDSITETLGDGDAATAADTEADTVRVPSIIDALWYAPGVLAQAMIFVGTLYFFLLSRTDIYKRINSDDSNLNTAALLRAERRVSRYFLTITAINASFGAIVGGVMIYLDMPYPIIWGLGAFLVNYVLYVGPAMFACALLLTGFVVHDGPASFIPALAYLAMNATEGQFVTPSFVGKQMSINPLMVFVSLIFWLWLWGPLGGIIAIPILVWSLCIQAAIKGEKNPMGPVDPAPNLMAKA